MINERLLTKALSVKGEVADAVAPHLDVAAQRWGIVEPKMVAAWLAQCAHESALFTRTEENLIYRGSRLVAVWPSRFRFPLTLAEASIDPFEDGKRNPSFFDGEPVKLANVVYANRMGNGPPESGDGWRYRGRGFIQLTGKRNITNYLSDAGKPQADPAIISTPHYAADSAGWFWKTNRLGRFVIEGDLDGLTKAINGGMHGAKEREDAYRLLLRDLA